MSLTIFLDAVESLQLLEYEKIDTQLLKENGLYELFILILEKSLFGHTVSDFHNNYFYCPILNNIYELSIFEINFFDFDNSKIKFNILFNKLNYVLENEKMDKKLFDYLMIKKYILLKSKKYLDQPSESELNIDENNIFYIIHLIFENVGIKNFKKVNILINSLDKNLQENKKFDTLKKYLKSLEYLDESEDDTNLLLIIDEMRKSIYDRLSYLNVEKDLVNAWRIMRELGILNMLRIRKKENLFFDCKIDLPVDSIYYKDIKHVVDVNYLTNTYKIDREPYFNYLNTLVMEKYSNISKSLFSEYMTLLFNKGKYLDCVNFYNQYKNVFSYILKSTCNPLIKLNTALYVIKSNLFNNSLISCREITDIIDDIDFSDIKLTENYGKVLDYIKKIKTSMRSTEEKLIRHGFKIKYINNANETEMCLICNEVISQNTITTVECQGCKNEIGHMKCVFEWFTSSNNLTCPYCRYHK
jgi:hypothetical protein